MPDDKTVAVATVVAAVDLARSRGPQSGSVKLSAHEYSVTSAQVTSAAEQVQLSGVNQHSSIPDHPFTSIFFCIQPCSSELLCFDELSRPFHKVNNTYNNNYKCYGFKYCSNSGNTHTIMTRETISLDITFKVIV